MTRHWPVVILTMVAVVAALLFPLTSALPAPAAITARLGAATAALLLSIAIAAWFSAGRLTAMALAAGCGIAGLGLLLVHSDAQARCIAGFEGQDVIIGTQFSPEAQRYLEDNPGLSSADRLLDAGGVAGRIWTAESIRSCSLLVTWVGLGAIPLFAASAAIVIKRRRYVPGRPDGRPLPASPDTPQIYDAFLSYRHVEPDRTIAFELVATLERAGLRVAIDARDFSPNEHFLSEMERCIRQSRFVLCVITSQYVLSDHTSEEAIISRTLDLAERRRRLVPVIYERVELPVWLHGLVGIDFTADAAVDPHDRLLALVRGARL
jgi:hypothetical protein